MTLSITSDLITSDRRYAWRDTRGKWFTSWTATCFWNTRAEAEARMRYAEHVEADGPHPEVTDDEVDRWRPRLTNGHPPPAWSCVRATSPTARSKTT